MAPVWRRDPPSPPPSHSLRRCLSWSRFVRHWFVRSPYASAIGCVWVCARSLASSCRIGRCACGLCVRAARLPTLDQYHTITEEFSHDADERRGRRRHAPSRFYPSFPSARDGHSLWRAPPRVCACARVGGVREPARSCVFTRRVHLTRPRARAGGGACGSLRRRSVFCDHRCASLSHSVNRVVAPSRRVMIRCTG